VAKKRWLRKLIEKGPVLVEHYAHAAEVRVFLLRELLRARSQGIEASQCHDGSFTRRLESQGLPNTW
jgi:hypothetical protein